jgi:hypothetical protein
MQEFCRFRTPISTRVEAPLSLRLAAEAERRKITMAEVVREALHRVYPEAQAESEQIAA